MMSTASTEKWLQEIAEKAQVAQVAVQAVLDRHGIRPQGTLPRRRSVIVKSIAFKGTKQTDTSFQFDWPGLSPGVWALTSDKNSRGKSSIIRMMLGALRGDWPAGIKPDVWSWLTNLEVEFTIDGQPYRTTMEKESGPAAGEARARFMRVGADGETLSLYEGPLGQGLETTVNEVFQTELGFDEFRSFTDKTAATVSHGWQAMASALLINGGHGALFGDVQMAGMPLRLLQMFIGLPWISTATQVKTAIKVVERAAEEAKASPATKRSADRLAALRSKLQGLEAGRTAADDRAVLRERLSELDQKLADGHSGLLIARSKVTAALEILESTNAALIETKRLLQQMTDEEASGRVFRRLRPVCCPSCDRGIDAKSYEAADAITCALCGTEQDAETEEDDDASLVRADIASLEESVRRQGAEVERWQVDVGTLSETIKRSSLEMADINRKLADRDGTQAEREIITLEAQIVQLEEMAVEEPKAPDAAEADLTVLRAADKVTGDMFSSLQTEILGELSVVLTDLARRFGIENLEKIEIANGGQTRIDQGGTSTVFSKMSDGEKLRLKVSIALAVVQVARSRFHGRHPGIVFLDSPGSEEMTPDDFARLIASVQSAAESLQDVQIFVGTLARPELDGVVPLDRRREASASNFLF